MNLKINQFYHELTKLTALCKVWIHHNYTSWTVDGKIFRINKKHIGEEMIIWSFKAYMLYSIILLICLKISSGKGNKKNCIKEICTSKNERIHRCKKPTFFWFVFQPLEYNYPGYPTGYFYPGVPTNSTVAVPPSTQTYQLVDVPHTATGKLNILLSTILFYFAVFGRKKKQTNKKNRNTPTLKIQ